jgi:hypothetical protein
MFTADLNRFKGKFVNRATIAHHAVVLEMATRIINRMPVDTGRARANVTVSGGGGADLTNDYSPDVGGEVTITRVTGVVAGTASGETLVISNNVPYILALEFGHSQQAPNGMFAITVAEFSSILTDSVHVAIREVP